MFVKRVLLVGNPTAQSGKNKERIDAALELFRKEGVEAELFSTLPEGKTIPALAQVLETAKVDVVVAMGGDGTFREVGAALLLSDKANLVALGMLPTGTANDQGKSFGLSATPDSLATNVGIVVAGNETRLDAGHLFDVVTGVEHAFFDSAGFGMSARILSERNHDRAIVEKLGPLKEIYRDHLVYAGALARVLLESVVKSEAFTAEALIDEKPFTMEGLTDLVIKATRIYAGAWVLDRSCKHDDGAFELVPFRGKLDWSSKAIVDLEGNPITEEMLNAIGVEHSKPIRGSAFRLRFDRPMFLQIDGEELPATSEAVITITPRAIRLVVPPETELEK